MEGIFMWSSIRLKQVSSVLKLADLFFQEFLQEDMVTIKNHPDPKSPSNWDLNICEISRPSSRQFIPVLLLQKLLKLVQTM